MTGKQLASAGLSAIVAVGMHPAALAGHAIATDWAESTLTQEGCFARAEATLTQLGFATIERTRFSRVGQTGELTQQVRCMAEKKLVLFVTAGPSPGGRAEISGSTLRQVLN
jgi:hypothetical protein